MPDASPPRPALTRRADVVFLRPGTVPVLPFEVCRRGEPLHESEDGLFRHSPIRVPAG